MSTEEKIPSPQEIKGEVKKFTPKEIDDLKNFQIKLEQVILQLGKVRLSKIKLDEYLDKIGEEE